VDECVKRIADMTAAAKATGELLAARRMGQEGAAA
jgi:hypothetical protein